MEHKPSLGRIVLYNNDGVEEPAIVIDVLSDEIVTLTSCNKGGTWTRRPEVSRGSITVTEHGKPNTWRWPPRV